MSLSGFILFGTLCAYCTWVSVSFFRFRKFSAIISPNMFSTNFALSSSGTPIMRMLVCLMLSHRSLKLSSFFKNLFFFDWVFSIILSSRLLMRASVSPSLRNSVPSSVFFISVTVFFSFDWFFYIFSSSLLKFSLCSSILFPSSISILITIALNYLSGKLFISLGRFFQVIFPCSFI